MLKPNFATDIWVILMAVSPQAMSYCACGQN
jgi:hypothetical protein